MGFYLKVQQAEAQEHRELTGDIYIRMTLLMLQEISDATFVVVFS